MGAALYVALSQEDRDGAAKDRIIVPTRTKKLEILHASRFNSVSKN